MRNPALSGLVFVLLAACGKQSPPQKPMTPIGPTDCTTGVAYNYRVMTIHPEVQSVEFQFDWGGAVGDWGNWAASGETAEVSHVFDTAGTYPIAARARDSAGLLSEWSDPLSVTAVSIPSGPARNLSLRAETDSTVRLAWSPPVEGTPNQYLVMFKPVGGTYAVALETGDTTCEHDPAGLTGEYRVLAQFGGRYVEPEETLSTLPVQTNSTWVDELNASGKPGLGWPAPARVGVTYDMSDTAWVDLVEFYVTDFKAGSSGPTYYLASPDLAPGDSGGGVPAGRWQVTSFVELASEQGPLPAPGDSSWRTSARVASTPVYAGCRTQQDFYAVVKVTQMRITQADVRLETWFQPVQGLRLLRH
ncbi:fibronectin type III domain-containing protein [candidate division WOR-3 bacterium]|nr:fibronectin type III domain-containing protein [candidate division WOR-3 bacterium]